MEESSDDREAVAHVESSDAVEMFDLSKEEADEALLLRFLLRRRRLRLFGSVPITGNAISITFISDAVLTSKVSFVEISLSMIVSLQ